MECTLTVLIYPHEDGTYEVELYRTCSGGLSGNEGNTVFYNTQCDVPFGQCDPGGSFSPGDQWTTYDSNGVPYYHTYIKKGGNLNQWTPACHDEEWVEQGGSCMGGGVKGEFHEGILNPPMQEDQNSIESNIYPDIESTYGDDIVQVLSEGYSLEDPGDEDDGDGPTGPPGFQ